MEGGAMEPDPVQVAEIRKYVADMAQQLADLCRETMPVVAKVLDVASEMAKTTTS